jgi:hypothetical protein
MKTDPKLGRAEALREAMLAYMNDKKSDLLNRSGAVFHHRRGSREMRGSGHAAEHPLVAGRHARALRRLHQTAKSASCKRLGLDDRGSSRA